MPELWPKRRRVMQPARSIFSSLLLLTLPPSLSFHLQPFVGAPFGPLAVARRCRFAIFGHLPRPAWDQSCHSCSHSLSHSFTHSLPHSFTTFSLLCGLCHVKAATTTTAKTTLNHSWNSKRVATVGSSQSQFRPFPHANRASCCRLQSERWRHVKITITICKTTPNARGDLCDRRQANRDPRKETTVEKDSKKSQQQQQN